MNEMKYVMFNNNNFILIPKFMNHADMLTPSDRENVKSAGEIEFYYDRENEYGEQLIRCICSGRSTSLKKESLFQEDEKYINSALRI